MTTNSDFSAKTFDQLVASTDGDISEQRVSPHRLVRGEIVFERLGNGVRVTARDEQHRVLWGYVASKETVTQVHCLVAMYSLMQEITSEELAKHGLYAQIPSKTDEVAHALTSLTDLEGNIKRLRESLNVKKVSSATIARAKVVSRLVSDFGNQLANELGPIPAIRTEPE